MGYIVIVNVCIICCNFDVYDFIIGKVGYCKGVVVLSVNLVSCYNYGVVVSIGNGVLVKGYIIGGSISIINGYLWNFCVYCYGFGCWIVYVVVFGYCKVDVFIFWGILVYFVGFNFRVVYDSVIIEWLIVSGYCFGSICEGDGCWIINIYWIDYWEISNWFGIYNYCVSGIVEVVCLFVGEGY